MSGTNKVVQSALDRAGESALAKGLLNANEEAKKKEKPKKK
jgi:hypothetical protein